MLPPLGERRVESFDEEPSGEDAASSPPEENPDPVSDERRRESRTRDLVALYAVRAEANGIDLRPLIDERRERRPTEAATVMVMLPAITEAPPRMTFNRLLRMCTLFSPLTSLAG